MSFRIDPRLPLTGEVRRILADEIGKAIGHLETAREKPEQGLHKCRKRLKSVRALLRLVRSGDEPFCQTENECYKQVSALLAGPREATALIETVDRLADAFPEQSAGGGLDPVRERLALPDQPEQAADILADGARATLRRAKKALDKAESRGEPDDFHDLRKAAKTHSMHLSLLGRLWPTPIKARRKAVDRLGEQLGELHDVFVMRALLDAEGEPLGPVDETKLLRKLLKRSEKSLTKACLADAAELFGDSPKRSAKRLARKARDDLAAPQEEAKAA